MNIVVILGSNRNSGKHSIVKDNLCNAEHKIEFVELSKMSVSGCTACEECTRFGMCVLPKDDDFDLILSKMETCDALFIVTPIYAPIPSKLAALLERLLSISFFGGKIGGNDKPLLNKKVAIVSYGANGIYDSTSLQIMTQQLFTNDYSFNRVDYPFIGSKVDFVGKVLADYVQELVDSL